MYDVLYVVFDQCVHFTCYFGCPRPYQWWRGWWGQWEKWGQCATATPAAAGTSALRANTWAAGPNGASCMASQEQSWENRKEGELGTGGASTLFIRDLFQNEELDGGKNTKAGHS